MYTLIIEDRAGNISDEVSFDQGSYTIGRVEGNDIILPSNAVSRTHARIFVSQGRCFIDDLGSANGVMVDGEPLNQRRELRNAAQIRIGDYTLYLEHSDRPADGGQDVLKTHIVANDENTFKLVRVGDMFAGEEFSLTESINTIGRTDDNFILLSDPSISRNHSQIINEGIAYRLVDLGSSNGTKINGKMLRGAVHLRTGDEVQFGNVRFVFAPGAQRVDIAAYAKARRGGGGILIAVIVLLALAVIGGGIFALVSVLRSPSDKKPVAQENQQDPAEALKEKYDAAVAAANQQKWAEAQRLLSEVMAADPSYRNSKDLQAHVVSELANLGHLNQGNDLINEEKYAQAKTRFEQIPQSSAYFERAKAKLLLVNQELSNQSFVEGMKACDAEVSVDCVRKVCESLQLNPDNARPKVYLKKLLTSDAVKKDARVKKAISRCLGI